MVGVWTSWTAECCRHFFEEEVKQMQNVLSHKVEQIKISYLLVIEWSKVNRYCVIFDLC